MNAVGGGDTQPLTDDFNMLFFSFIIMGFVFLILIVSGGYGFNGSEILWHPLVLD